MTRRFALLLLPLALVAVACNGGDDATPTTLPPQTSPPLPTMPPELTTVATEPTSTEPSVTTEPDVTTTTATPAPTTTTTLADTTATTQPGDPDWVAIVQGLLDVLVELQGAPDAARVTEFCFDAENDCQNIQGEAIRQYDEEGWRTLDFPSEVVLSAELSATQGDQPLDEAGFVVVLVTTGPQDFSNTRVVDSSGELVFTMNADGDGGRGQWLLARNDAGAWRVISIQGLPQ